MPGRGTSLPHPLTRMVLTPALRNLFHPFNTVFKLVSHVRRASVMNAAMARQRPIRTHNPKAFPLISFVRPRNTSRPGERRSENLRFG